MIDFGDSASNSDDAAEPDAPHSPTHLHHLDHLEQNSSKLLNVKKRKNQFVTNKN